MELIDEGGNVYEKGVSSSGCANLKCHWETWERLPSISARRISQVFEACPDVWVSRVEGGAKPAPGDD